MVFNTTNYGADAQILKRSVFEAIPLALDFSSVTDTKDGKKIVYAGTPVDASGVVANGATAIGIVLHDTVEDDPNAAILKKAYLDTVKAEANVAKAASQSAFTYDPAVKTALPMIIFE